VTRHGTSPRILQASVVGTRGRTAVAGQTLQSVFGLLTTYAAFTTISSTPVTARTVSAGSASAARALTGTVYPAQAGSSVWVQASTGGRWHTIDRTKTGRSGGYSAALPGPGTYRVQFQRLRGPSVAVR
jgi:hypothetical protein